ncbi:MAG: hypothetical protein KKB51_14030 [Candidatus Riflebacteria bacterium]|nr:hypothetical protein [Candidatus Riflebacteria bacterium]
MFRFFPFFRIQGFFLALILLSSLPVLAEEALSENISQVDSQKTSLSDSQTTGSEKSSSSQKTSFWKRIVIRPRIESYLPANEKVQKEFGKSWNSFGLMLGARAAKGSSRNSLELSIDRICQEKNDSKATIVPVQFAYRHYFSDSTSFRTYFSAGISGSFVDFDSKVTGKKSEWECNGIGTVFALGANINKRLFAEVKFLAVPEVKEFDFSGTKFAIGYRF